MNRKFSNTVCPSPISHNPDPMREKLIPKQIPNWIDNQERPASTRKTFEKINPDNGELLCMVARSGAHDVEDAVKSAKHAQPTWAELPPVQRGEILHAVALSLESRRDEVAHIVALETGKSYKSALAETDGAVALGQFFAGEGQRLYGHTTTSAVANRYAMTIRQPVGVAGLIIAANTPIANVAWKVFPALICGNSAILKAAEDAPATAWIFGKIAHEAGPPSGVLNIIQGYGEEAGAALAAHPDVDVISFTGSTAVGRQIAEVAGKRLARISLELGGKNPFVVCDDADLDHAAHWAVLSAFSNAGQRCAAGSRIIIFDSIYDRFHEMLIERTNKLKIGPSDDDDFGPVINAQQLDFILKAVENAKRRGAKILTGGHRLTDAAHRRGFYMSPTLIGNVSSDDELSTTELFGPLACLYRVKDFSEALTLANNSPYGLTACIHTRSVHRAIQFTQKVQAGVAVVNAGTYGSEPHMAFGGVKQSGNGTREPGAEALDVYSTLKSVYLNIDTSQL